MGICVHCMQPKPITANKCPHCHERTGVIESTFWTVFGKLLYWFFLLLLFSMFISCAVGAEIAVDPAQHIYTQDLK